jgi:hypothetical protein
VSLPGVRQAPSPAILGILRVSSTPLGAVLAHKRDENGTPSSSQKNIYILVLSTFGHPSMA